MQKKYYPLILMVTMSSLLFSEPDKPTGFASVSGKGCTTTTGGAGGATLTVTSFDELKKYAESSNPYIILVKGRITPPAKGDAINVTSNKTIVGLGNDATLYQIELHIILQRNIIIRNLVNRDSYVEGNYDCKDTDWDGIQADSCHHLWIDHCWFTHNCDGLIDLRKSCDYVTVSWVHLSNHNKTFGIGWTTNTDFRQTIHHCYFDSTNQRNPSFDMGMGHLYNNFVRKAMSYGNLARGDARVIIENSYYENAKNPVQISDNAKLYISGLQFSGCSGSTSGNQSTPPFDVGKYYAYTLDKTSEVKSIVSSGAGPNAAIGEQYLQTSIIPAGHTMTDGADPLLQVKVQRSNTLQIGIDFDGSYTLTIVTIDGRIVGRITGAGPRVFSSRIPAGGLYLMTFKDSSGSRQQWRVIAAQNQEMVVR